MDSLDNIPILHFFSASIVFVYFMYFYFKHFKQYDTENQKSLSIFNKTYNPKRGLQSAKRLRKYISNKFENILNYEPDYLSNRFYRRFEFCVAEILIFNLCLMDFDTNIETKVMYKCKKIIDSYLKVFTDFEHRIILESLQSRICMNLASINNIPTNVLMFMNVDKLFTRNYSLPIYPEIISLKKNFCLSFETKKYNYNFQKLKECIYELTMKY